MDEAGLPGVMQPITGATGHCGRKADTPGQGVSAARREEMRQAVEKTAEKILEEAEKGRGIGALPGGAHYIETARRILGRSKIDYRRELARVLGRELKRHGCDDYSRGLGRRTLAGGTKAIYPRPISRTPSIAIVLDISGSMGAATMDAAREAAKIAQACGGTVTVYETDTAVQRVVTIRDDDDYVRHGLPHAGGGTRMQSGVTAAMTARPIPQVIMIVGDGDTMIDVGRTGAATSVIAVLVKETKVGTFPATPDWFASRIEVKE